ncbi:pyridoxal reductase Plr1 [Yamadazyma tenuis]|uniref:Aldo/keto reductase n=1 Tax=Candida tenuis (strain ATCC 10573 / BCRC 21748 / CBS 615 / JCM 9827 / NBRC 10315 / NRRL Y-1498 / VKM Y-70) TaxID=590646 RepID=G3B875_CANTC|nr:Aldo/keto reductase [Yamadazyma tenuis ATCC 10573]XP_006688795.1 uncharacterized protein CANTEDRAFT_115166 [Yamadazyma tenuis ATCC 10573]EGV62624.1 Aldo/keto reductase [Yamadazyma tenuis ATCC 10573]EGV62625.1 hypothetical protein CANTEDRAFT_115166 [Yamadazyma tenuis ATCC 10573]WEJ92938.1 pyridoxal reductase Plr1 [Yamadazyma tenuis]
MSTPCKISTKGFGTMSMTWCPSPPPFSKSLDNLKYVKNTYGVKFFNCGEFYQTAPETANLKLISQFCEQEKDEDIIISIKGAFDLTKFAPDGSKEFINKSIDNSLSYFKDLEVKPKILFECGRVDPNVPIEDSVSYIYERVKSGDLAGICITEVSAASVKKAAATAPISGIEVEFSLFSEDIFTNGVLEEASKHQIAIIAYSPLSRGILTDYAAEHPDFLKSIPPQDMKNHFDRFQPENYEKNKGRLHALYQFAKTKNLSLEALALSYIESLSGIENFEGIPKVTTIIPIPSGSTKEKIDKNFGSSVKLSREDLEALHKILKEHSVSGGRYYSKAIPFLEG